MNRDNFEIVNGCLVKYNGQEKNVVIPDGVTAVNYNAFGRYNSEIESIHIPSDVSRLCGDGDFFREDTPFDAMVNLRKITVDPESKYFKVSDNALYSKDGRSLYRVFAENKIEEFTLPQSVRYIKFKAIHYNTVDFAYIAGNNIKAASYCNINADFYAPDVILQKLNSITKTEAVNGFAVAVKRGYEINEDVRRQYISYIKSQAKRLIEYGARRELVMFMAQENIFPKDMYDDCIAFYGNIDDTETTTVLTECKERFG